MAPIPKDFFLCSYCHNTAAYKEDELPYHCPHCGNTYRSKFDLLGVFRYRIATEHIWPDQNGNPSIYLVKVMYASTNCEKYQTIHTYGFRKDVCCAEESEIYGRAIRCVKDDNPFLREAGEYHPFTGEFSDPDIRVIGRGIKRWDHIEL